MKNSWKLKDILLIAICAVLFGVVYLGVTYAGAAVGAALTPFGMTSMGYEPFYGIYFMAAAFAAYVIRKPGAGIIAEILAAIIETMMGNFFGPKIILSGFVQGLGIELIFMLTRYKKWDYKTMCISAVICSVMTMIYNLFVSGYIKIAVPVLLLMLAVRLVSAVLIDGLLVKFLGDGLAKAGVLKGYAVAGGMQQNLDD
ncbi:MAG: ECF transporter S component [Clostridia bacterium]|nr:ECF transporter S component [Clostridia bacterium]